MALSLGSAIALLITIGLWAGRYHAIGSGPGHIAVVDRLTGAVWFCGASFDWQCRRAGENEKPPKPIAANPFDQFDAPAPVSNTLPPGFVLDDDRQGAKLATDDWIVPRSADQAKTP